MFGELGLGGVPHLDPSVPGRSKGGIQKKRIARERGHRALSIPFPFLFPFLIPFPFLGFLSVSTVSRLCPQCVPGVSRLTFW